MFTLNTDLALFHVMADCEYCDVWLSAIEQLAGAMRGRMALAVVSPEPLERLASRADRGAWTIPFYSAQSCSFSEDMGFLRSDTPVGVAGIVLCQIEENRIYLSAKAPFGPSPFCSLWIFADRLNHVDHS